MWVHGSLSDFMGSVIVTFKIMPQGVEADLDYIEKTLEQKIKPQRMQRIPIAFGLNSIVIVKLVEEKEGEMDRITEEIKKIKGVRGVEVTNVTRSL